jgi:AcrR family transcriptional regulator
MAATAKHPARPTRRPRKDQLRNRARLLAVARDAFREQGLDASIDEIARRAGVGVTTFYRHFPGKAALIEALTEDLFDGFRRVAERAAALDDPWEAFAVVIRDGCALLADDLALYDMITARMSPELRERVLRVLTGAIVGDIVRRAHAAGQLRPDVSVEDVPALLRMAASAAPPWAGKAARRRRRHHADILLDGLRATSGA